MFAQDSVGPDPTQAPMSFQPRAGNTVDSLRPVNGALKSSERLVTEGLTTKPEPVEILQSVAKEILQNADVIDEHLATQGEQLNRAAILEMATMPPTELQKKQIEEANKIPFTVSDAPVSQKQLAELKENFNDSMGEVANMLLELQQYNALLEERIAKYNQRGGHRI